MAGTSAVFPRGTGYVKVAAARTRRSWDEEDRTHLLPPRNVNVHVDSALSELERAVDVQTHVAADHEREVVAERLAVCFEEVQIATDEVKAVAGRVGKGDLATPEAHLTSVGRLRPREVERDAPTVLGAPSDHLVDRLAAELAEEVPDGEVDDADGGHREALGPVERRGLEHLVPHAVLCGERRSAGRDATSRVDSGELGEERTVSRGSEPTTKREKCCSMSQHAGGPPKPVETPCVPSLAVTMQTSEPSTSMPHDVRLSRYCS